MRTDILINVNLKFGWAPAALLYCSLLGAEEMRSFEAAADDFSKCAAYFNVSAFEHKDSNKTRYSTLIELAEKARTMAVINEAAATTFQGTWEDFRGSSEHQRINRMVLDRVKKYIKSMFTISTGKATGMNRLHAVYGTRCLDANDDLTVFLRK